MRVVQPAGTLGSLKWMQKAVAQRPDLLQPEALKPLEWVSPLASDGFAEYRDAGFLGRLGLGRLAPALAEFWPRRGPQWDGLATFPGGVVLAEAKAHLAEFDSPPSTARAASAARIAAAFASVQADLGLAPRRWDLRYYQYANRIAHLWWLRRQGIDAHLLLIGFLGDDERGGPVDPAAWHAAHAGAEAELGLVPNPLAPWVHTVCPDTRLLQECFRGP